MKLENSRINRGVVLGLCDEIQYSVVHTWILVVCPVVNQSVALIPHALDGSAWKAGSPLQRKCL